MMTAAGPTAFRPTDHLLPRPTPDNADYWSAAAEHRFVLPHCAACRRDFFPVSPRCPHCLSDQVEWRAPQPCGTVASWIRYRKAYYPWVEAHLPYVGILVDVVPGVRIPMLAWPTPTRDPKVGERVEITFLDIREGVSLPVCRLAP